MVFSGLMDASIKKKIEEKYVQREVDVRPGDTVKVHLQITEAGKERIQVLKVLLLQ